VREGVGDQFRGLGSGTERRSAEARVVAVWLRDI
jgi:hypothetical protein